MALIEQALGLNLSPTTYTGPERLQDSLYHLHHASKRQVVVQVNEYDKPIPDMLHDPDDSTANRNFPHWFYGIAKSSAKHVRFLFVTGISMFAERQPVL